MTDVLKGKKFRRGENSGNLEGLGWGWAAGQSEGPAQFARHEGEPRPFCATARDSPG